MPTPVLVNSRTPVPIQAERMKLLEDRLAKIDRQVATGDRLLDPSDDPSGALRAALLLRQDARLQSGQKALDRAKGRLTAAESAAKPAAETLVRAREIGLLAANGTFSADDREAMAKEVAGLSVQLLQLANTRDESGRHVFAGSRGAAPAYAVDPAGDIVWQGFDAAPGAEAAGLERLRPPRGPALFGTDAAGSFAHLKQLEAALQNPDPEARNTAIAGALAGLEGDHSRMVNGWSAIGASVARLDLESDRTAEARLSVSQALADVRGVDLTAAFAEIGALQLALSAARTSFSRINEGSLFDRLG